MIIKTGFSLNLLHKRLTAVPTQSYRDCSNRDVQYFICKKQNVWHVSVFVYPALRADCSRLRSGRFFHPCRSQQTGSDLHPGRLYLLYCETALQRNDSGVASNVQVFLKHKSLRALSHLLDRRPWRFYTSVNYTKPRPQTSYTRSVWRTGCLCSYCDLGCIWRWKGSRLVLHLQRAGEERETVALRTTQVLPSQTFESRRESGQALFLFCQV